MFPGEAVFSDLTSIFLSNSSQEEYIRRNRRLPSDHNSLKMLRASFRLPLAYPGGPRLLPIQIFPMSTGTDARAANNVCESMLNVQTRNILKRLHH